MKLPTLGLRVGGFLISVWVLIQFVDFEKVLVQLLQLPIWAVLAAAAVCTFRVWLTGVRWRFLTPDRSMSHWRYFQYVMVGSTFNVFMPGSLGGDFARAALIYQTETQNRASYVISIWVDRLIGFISILILGLLFSLAEISATGHRLYLAINGVILLSLVSLLALASTRRLYSIVTPKLKALGGLGKGIQRLLEVWREMIGFYVRHVRVVFIALLLCLPIHLIWLGVVYAFATLQAMPIDFMTLSAVTTIVWVISAMPVTIAGLGVRELSFVYLLSMQGFEPELATALSLQQFALHALIALIGLPFVWTMRRAKTGLPKPGI